MEYNLIINKFNMLTRHLKAFLTLDLANRAERATAEGIIDTFKGDINGIN